MSKKRNELRAIKRRYNFLGFKIQKKAKHYLRDMGFNGSIGKFIDYLREME